MEWKQMKQRKRRRALKQGMQIMGGITVLYLFILFCYGLTV